MYANFGPWGVLVGMTLLGLVYRLLHACLNHAQAGDGGLLVAGVTFRTLLNIESDFTLVFGGVLQGGILFAGILWLIARRREPGAG